MSADHEHRPSRTERPVPTPGEGQQYAIQPALVPDRHQPGAIEFARKCAHDHLLKLWGDLVVSHVWWTQYYGADGAKAYRAAYSQTANGVDAEAEQFLDDNPRLVVIIAWAIARQGEPNGPLETRWYSSKDET